MRYILVILFSIFLSNTVVAEDTTIEMLNKLDKRNMVFSTEIVRINSGDTVFWKATDKGQMYNLYQKMESLRELKNLNLRLGKIQNLLLLYRVSMLTGAHLIKQWV